ncbi:hypothetical protein [Mesorhizobium sp. M0037]|uniref:hypothetical protein n=1 Tax=unclassified Mesorhizobium TaxID=325217 RepID=UPI003335E679
MSKAGQHMRDILHRQQQDERDEEAKVQRTLSKRSATYVGRGHSHDRPEVQSNDTTAARFFRAFSKGDLK